MSNLLADLRADLTRLAVGLILVAVLGAATIVGAQSGVVVPVGTVLLVALGVALVAGPAATGLVAIAACWVVLLNYVAFPTDNVVVRYLTVVGICALATVASALRRRRERSLLVQAVDLALAHDHEVVGRVSRTMMEQVPGLSVAVDVPAVARNAVRIGREVFEASACSYWQVDGDECYLVARDPSGAWAPGQRISVATMQVTDGGARTSFARRSDLPDGSPRAAAMDQGGAVTGTSTAIRVDGATVAFLALSWSTDVGDRSPAWFDLLDRFGDQVALAKTVVRRRLAQEQTQRLGRRLQHALLPNPVPDAGGVRSSSLYRPGTRDLLLGGDFLDLTDRRESDGRIAFLLGDVSGHGPEQAAAAASLRSAWSAMAVLPGLGISEWAAGMTHVLAESDPEQAMFVTVVMGTFDPDEKRLRYVTAGHPPPILLGAAGRVVGEQSGPPLGVVPDVKLEEFVLDVAGLMGVLLVTDGIFEGFVAPGCRQRVGWDDFVDIVHGGLDPTSGSYLDLLADDMEHRNGGPMADDVAALLLLWDDVRDEPCAE